MNRNENNLWLTHLIDEEIYLIDKPKSELKVSVKVDAKTPSNVVAEKEPKPQTPLKTVEETPKQEIPKAVETKEFEIPLPPKINPLPTFEKVEEKVIQAQKTEVKMEKVVFLVFYENEKIAPAQVLDVIQKSMASLNILPENFSILNLASQSAKVVEVDCEKVLIAGAEKYLSQLKFNKSIKILITASIDSYLSDRNSKMIIWNKMKEFFS